MVNPRRSANLNRSKRQPWTQEKFRALLESAPDAMVIASEQGRITLVNAQTERLFGYKREELLGLPIEILIPERFRSRHLHHRKEYSESPRLRLMGAGRELFGLTEDGRELSAQLVKTRRDMKVLFMSGHTAGVISQHALLGDEGAFIEKPFSHDPLGRKIRQILDGEA